MKIVIDVFDYQHAIYCIEKNIDAIIIGNNEFSLRNSFSFSKKEIMTIIKGRKHTKVFLKFNAIFFESQLKNITEELISISKMDIDGIIFQDLAVAQINEELNLNLKLRYNPETLITSHYQFDFYKEVNFSCVTLARELMMFEIEEILENKILGLELETQGHGLLFIMHSRWNLISNFEDHYNFSFSSKNIIIKEELRKIPNILFEDKHGTHMMSGYEMYSIDLFEKFKKLDWLRIDTLNLNKEYVYYITDLYINGLKSFKENIENYNKITSNLKTEISSKTIFPISHGFLGGTKDMLHKVKND